jgi:hypothetical protein
MPGVASPPVILEAFGIAAGTSYITNPIPLASQQPNPRASYTDGFPPQTVGASGTPPDVRDVNGILFAVSANIAAFSAGQFFQFNSAIATQDGGYALGAIVETADNSGWWVNKTSGNVNNPDTAAAGSGWVPVAQYGLTALTGLTNANVTLTAPQAGKNIVTLAGALTGNIQIVFPPWTSEWTIINNTTGAFTVTCKTAAGTGVIVPQGVGTLIYGDGTNIDLVGTSLSANTGAVANTLALRDAGAGLTASSFNVASDAALKEDITRIKGDLDHLDQFHGVTYRLKATGEVRAGLIAQQFMQVRPEGVHGGKDGFLAIDPMAVIAELTELLRAERDARRALEGRVARLEARR